MYVLLDIELYKKGVEGLLLKCLNKLEAMRVIGEVYQEIYVSHKSSPKTRWLIHKRKYYWLTVIMDYYKYAKWWKACVTWSNLKTTNRGTISHN